jgi:predicted metal-dependent hydrolase
VPEDKDRLGRSIQAFLRTLARDRLAAASDRYAAALGRPYGKITLRDTRSRWGSCTSQGDLMYSWRLIMAPPAVLDYVAAHEVAHLERMDHSPAFWNIVARLCPDHARHRDWLRTEGTALHRVRFGD